MEINRIKELAGLTEAAEVKEPKKSTADESKPAGKDKVEKLDFEVVVDKNGAPKVSDELVTTTVDTGSGPSQVPKGKLKLKEAFEALMEKKKSKKHTKSTGRNWTGGYPVGVGLGNSGNNDNDDGGDGGDGGGD